MKQPMKIKLLLIVCCFACSACSIVPVKPWQKGTLASETMRFGGPNSMIKKFDEHIYTSKEGSKGGGGVSGGGCGCN
jgi:hypothetical protein